MNKEDLEDVSCFTLEIFRDHINELMSTHQLRRENKLTSRISLQVWFQVANKVFYQEWLRNAYYE